MVSEYGCLVMVMCGLFLGWMDGFGDGCMVLVTHANGWMVYNVGKCFSDGWSVWGLMDGSGDGWVISRIFVCFCLCLCVFVCVSVCVCACVRVCV